MSEVGRAHPRYVPVEGHEVLALVVWVFGAYLALMLIVTVVIVLPALWRGRRAPEPLVRGSRRDTDGEAGTAAPAGVAA